MRLQYLCESNHFDLYIKIAALESAHALGALKKLKLKSEDVLEPFREEEIKTSRPV